MLTTAAKSPVTPGEVFVLDDGGEADLDLGNYERYLDVTLSKDNNITTGKIYREVIEKEVSAAPVFPINICQKRGKLKSRVAPLLCRPNSDGETTSERRCRSSHTSQTQSRTGWNASQRLPQTRRARKPTSA